VPRILEHALESGTGTRPSTTEFDRLRRSARGQRAFRRAARTLLQAIVFVGLVSLFFLRAPQVEGRSMLPSIAMGNHVVINTLAYGVALGPWTLESGPVKRNDVIAFGRRDGDDIRVLLKRVIALPGETVAIRAGTIFVGGTQLRDLPFVLRDHTDMKPMLIPTGSVFVLGDNRAQSADSRLFGPVPLASVIGKAVLIVWPLDDVKRIL
jgi:signal peptidase I